jgi:branched-subunit amino acid aminotransferase/4-amino-4-deoxychorismate lyase
MGVIVVEAHEGPAVLGAAEAVFITNSLIGVRMAARYGETVYGSCRLADRLAAACADIA